MDHIVVLSDAQIALVRVAVIFALRMLIVDRPDARDALAALDNATHQPEWLEEPGS